MKNSLLVGVLVTAMVAPVGASADKVVTQVLSDLDRFEQQFSGSGTVNRAAAKRTLRLLEIRRQTLDSVADKSTPQWQEADRRLRALHDRLTTGSSGKPAATPVPASQPKVAAAAPATKQTMISQQRARLKKLKRDIDSTMQSLDQGGVQPFQDSAYVKRYEQRYQHYRQMLDKYRPFAGDPDVMAAEDALARLKGMLAFGKQQAAATQAKTGDVQARLRRIDTMMQALKFPPQPAFPPKPGALKTWLGEVQKLKQQADKGVAELQQIAQQAHLPNNPGTVQQGAPYDSNDLRRMLNHLGRLSARADEAVRNVDGLVMVNLQHGEQTLNRIAGYDPNDPNHQSNYFLGEGRSTEMIAQLEAVRTLAEEGAMFSRLLGDKDKQARREAMAKKAQQTLARYQDKRHQALASVTMPKAASTDASLLKVARETLAKKKYGVGPIERMVITAPKRSLSKETSEEEFDSVDVSLDGTITLKGTKTTYHYEWEEFQVATAEREGDKYYIYYNTLKYFTKGASTTPMNRWVLSKRFRGNEILKENIPR